MIEGLILYPVWLICSPRLICLFYMCLVL